MNKFEQLIEYVINDEDAKARELFHDIVVEKSREIYEEMMEAESVEESEEITEESTHDEDEKAEKAGKKVTKDIEYDDKKDKMDESEEAVEEGFNEELGGDQADDLIDDVEVEEEGISMEGEGEEMADEDLEDRVVDLEDKLDELMAEFEALMGDDMDGEEEVSVDDEEVTDFGGDMDSEEVVDDELETEGYKMPMEEAVSLKAAPKPVTAEEGGVNKKSTVAFNSGAKGSMAKPVHATGGEEKGRPAPQAKDMGSTTEPNVKPATKPHLAQAAGVNNKSVIQ